MTSNLIRWANKPLAMLLAFALMCSSLPAQQPADYTFRVQTDLVLVNVTVRDKNGNLIRGLKPEDFTILEDNKPQKVVSSDVENIDAVANQDVAQTNLLPGPPTAEGSAAGAATSASGSANQFKDRRLIVLFFDLSAMEPDEIDRAITSAEHYIDTQMAPADLVSIVSLGSSLLVNQDFTSDHGLLKKQLQAFSSGSGLGFEEGTTGTTEGTPDTGQPFTADDTEYNIFNTDRRLEALRSVAEKLSHLQQKKSLIYFSSGMDRTGIENQSELRAAINAAVRSNMAIYTMDLRGLQALVAGGEAQNASLRGTSAYSGQSMINALNSNFTTQETLVTLASDTGGRAFLDSNDFTQVFKASPYENLQWKVEEVVVDFDAVRVLMPLPAPFGAIWITLHFGPGRSSFECEPVTCSSCARRPGGRASGARWRPRTSIRLARPKAYCGRTSVVRKGISARMPFEMSDIFIISFTSPLLA